MDSKILITGGAGYIGSHMVYALKDKEIPCFVVDNFSTGSKQYIPKGVPYLECNVSDHKLLKEIIIEHNVSTVIHFAASIKVDESINNPVKYYENNVFETLSLIKTCLVTNIKNFIFSSTAAVYGDVGDKRVKENHIKSPESPYGVSKLMSEKIIEDISKTSNLNYLIFRYFNVAGADDKLRTGQADRNPSHLIKVACETALKPNGNMELYGNDYNTKDGTCVRDYIHVDDLILAHLNGLEYLNKNYGKSWILNCGYGQGFSVQEVINCVKEVSNNNFEVRVRHRRKGDSASTIANSDLCKKILGWKPKKNDLEKIILDTLAWEKKLLEKTK